MVEQVKSAVTGAASSAQDATNKMLGREQEEDKLASATDKLKGAAQDVSDAAGQNATDAQTSAQKAAAGVAGQAGNLADKLQGKLEPDR